MTKYPELRQVTVPTRFPENWSVNFQRYAFTKHLDQRDKYVNSGYYRHLVEVAALTTAYLHDWHAPPHLVRFANAVAMGHDLIEDQGGLETYNEIAANFGEELAMGILWLSDLAEGNREARKLASRKRMEQATDWLKIIKCCDLMSNLRTIAFHDEKFARTFIPEAYNLYGAMKMVWGEAGDDLRKEIFLNASLLNIKLEN